MMLASQVWYSSFLIAIPHRSMTFNTDITMYETLIRPHQVDILPALPSISSASDQLKQSEVRREAKRLRQIANSRSSKAGKRKPEEGEDKTDEIEVRKKRVRTDEAADSPEEDPASAMPLAGQENTQVTVPGTDTVAVDPCASSSKLSSDPAQNDGSSAKISVSKAFPEVRGHTSYLTFAVLLPAAVHETSAPEEWVVEGSGALTTGIDGE